MSFDSDVNFYDHYHQIWSERWPALYEVLLRPADEKFPRPNGFYQADCELQQFYFMDAASLFPVHALKLQGHEKVLDMCAAPGGKALMLAEQVLPGSGKLTVNEYSRTRFERLKKVFQEYVPQNLLPKVRFSNSDASRWGLKEPNLYDAVLLDAPCSGERHILHDAKELNAWSPSRSKQLAKRQYTLLCSGLMSLKPGGRLVYSTCALSPLENDGIIERLLSKKGEHYKILTQEAELGESTKHGWQILPDRSQGYGPIYWAAIEKL